MTHPWVHAWRCTTAAQSGGVHASSDSSCTHTPAAQPSERHHAAGDLGQATHPVHGTRAGEHGVQAEPGACCGQGAACWARQPSGAWCLLKGPHNTTLCIEWVRSAPRAVGRLSRPLECALPVFFRLSPYRTQTCSHRDINFCLACNLQALRTSSLSLCSVLYWPFWLVLPQFDRSAASTLASGTCL
jgi:hypothetical protein